MVFSPLTQLLLCAGEWEGPALSAVRSGVRNAVSTAHIAVFVLAFVVANNDCSDDFITGCHQ